MPQFVCRGHLALSERNDFFPRSTKTVIVIVHFFGSKNGLLRHNFRFSSTHKSLTVADGFKYRLQIAVLRGTLTADHLVNTFAAFSETRRFIP